MTGNAELGVVARYFDMLNAHDIAGMQSLLADDLVFVTPVEPLDAARFVEFMRGLFAAFADWRFDHDEPTQTGNTVTVALGMTGTHTGTLRLPLPGLRPVAPTGRLVTLPRQRFEYVVRGGRIARITPEPNPHGGVFGTLEQIGVKLPPLWVMKLVSRLARLRRRRSR